MLFSTSKFAAPIDLRHPERQIRGFLIPDSESSDKFVEITSGKRYEAGLIVYVGRKIDADEVFSKMATAGSTLPKEDIEAYLVDISAFKVGDVVGLELVDKTFRLVKLPAPARRPSKLPKWTTFRNPSNRYADLRDQYLSYQVAEGHFA